MIYLFCIIAYLILLGGIAVWKSGAIKNQSDFAVAGRSLNWTLSFQPLQSLLLC